MRMQILDVVMIAVLVAVFLILISPRVRNNRNWSAMVTPLASIIGSGFLVSVPLLAGAVGVWAVPAVMLLTGAAYLLGGVIRYNIQYGEPQFADRKTDRATLSLETLSHLVLTGAYFISVAYYLVLLAAFALKVAHIDNAFLGKAVATALVLVIAGIGALRGLGGIERAEKFTVSANLAAIAALLVSLLLFAVFLPQGYTLLPTVGAAHEHDWQTLRFLLGLLIIVQGFETTRFMGKLYPPKIRIRAMKRAQISSALVYIAFFILMLPLFPFFSGTPDVAGFIGEIGRVSSWLPYVVAFGAIASQFSAAVADSIGAGGLINDTSRNRVSVNHAYLLIGLVAVLVIWATDVVGIVALASRAFACFYFLQCLVALSLANARNDKPRRLGYGALATLCLCIAVFGIPAG